MVIYISRYVNHHLKGDYMLENKKIHKKHNYLSKDRLQICMLFLPGLIVFALFTVYPIIKLFIMSFYNYKIGKLGHSVFIGLENYINVFTDEISRYAIVNTLLYGLITVPAQIIIGLLVAVFINNISKGRVAFRTLYYLPVITSWVIVSVLFKYIFQNEGYLNYLLVNVFSLTNESIKWLETRSASLFVLSIIGIWKGIGWTMTVFIAALTSVPHELYDSAKVDGCNGVKRFFYITIPSIKNTILFSIVMLTIGAFNTFTPVKLITNGKPLHQTEFVLTWMYKNAFEYRNMGFAAALSFLIATIVAIITIIQFKLFKET
jgi:multiple sugar transport system permease protein